MIDSSKFLFFNAAFFDWRLRRIMSDFRCSIAEPRRWSAADVAAWVQWARRQLQLPSVPMESFNVDGATLASLTEEEFCQRAPQVSANILSSVLLYNKTGAQGRSENYTYKWLQKIFLFICYFFFAVNILLSIIFFCNFFHFPLNILRSMIQFACSKKFWYINLIKWKRRFPSLLPCFLEISRQNF